MKWVNRITRIQTIFSLPSLGSFMAQSTIAQICKAVPTPTTTTQKRQQPNGIAVKMRRGSMSRPIRERGVGAGVGKALRVESQGSRDAPGTAVEGWAGRAADNPFRAGRRRPSAVADRNVGRASLA